MSLLLGVAFGQIQLIADKHEYDIRLGVGLDLVQPLLDVEERLLVADVIHQYGGLAPAVVG